MPLLHFTLGIVWLVGAALAARTAGTTTPGWEALVLLVLLTTAIATGWTWARTRRAPTPERAQGLAAEHVPALRGEDLRELMRRLPDGVLLLVDGRIAQSNPAADAMFGQPADALAGEDAVHLVDAACADAFERWLRAPAVESDALPSTLCMRRRDGASFTAALASAEISHGARPAVLLIVRDLSDAERMRDELAAGNRELQALAARVFTLQEDERRAISRELHDDIGQSVTAMKMAASAALDEDDAQQRRDDLEDILVLADATLERLRDISILLRPPQLDALGLEAALRWHAERLLRGAGLVPALQIDALPRRPDAAVEQACFRIAQEALTNIMRHARARHVALRLRDLGDSLGLCVEDDGAGFAPGAARGLGLVIMRERAHVIGGHLDIVSTPGTGTRIEAWLPYVEAPASPPESGPGR
ncbi:PAS domain-containing sensor histidine kinase [Luteimonas deserti]|uniref:Oxygen sensor histidine kinase NreB n=1 Tax=Luteimonas deserti TaxID=2752306 RepID=A0A7Z0QT93_9GAMM|nr:ATP-binding protein [Luteimonas deserti]NYZ64333.1 PAS domain S-box protein [Luteimonas deserti]